jgi:TraM recognition site of TraD and TraG/Helicase HerA, central domain
VLRRRREPQVCVPPEPQGVVLGRRLSGEPVMPLSGSGCLVWPFERMRRHAVILGASGTGKTETAMRIAHEVAVKTEAPVFYLDAKGDRGSAERFCALMRAAGRRVHVFPNERFDAWRGDWRAIVNRLLEVIEFVPEGPAAYYRDIAKTALQLACHHPDGPPRSSAELLHRLDYELLLNAHGPSSAVLSLPRDKVSQVRLRYEAFFGQLGSLLDGNWSFEDADAAYFLLDSVALGEDTAGAASLLFADFAHYFTARKRRDRFCVMFCDEFAAIASSSDIAMKVEQARSFNTSLVLVPQTISGMGERLQRDRILGSVETVIAHAVNEPERLAELAGSRRVMELTHRFEEGVWNREGMARAEQRPKVDPDRIRDLPVGTAWVIRRGLAAKLAVQRAPVAAGLALPEPQPIDRLLERIEVAMPKKIAYLDDGEED